MIFPPRVPWTPLRRRRADDAPPPLRPARLRMPLVALLVGTQLASAAGAALAATVGDGGDDLVRAFGILLVIVSLGCTLAVALGLTASIRRLHEGATRDALTGLFNRAELIRRLDARLGHGRDAASTVLVAFDLDGFKLINDRFGHAAGDAVLRRVASLLERLSRRGDLVGRIGGDEFLLAVTVAPGQDPSMAVQRIRAALVARPVRAGGTRHRIGVTAGFARALPGESARTLIERADLALVAGKVRGKNRCYAAPAPRTLEISPKAGAGSGARPSSDRGERHAPPERWPVLAGKGADRGDGTNRGEHGRGGFGELP